MGNHRA
jgi:hypothetical protein